MIEKHDYYMQIAYDVAKRSTCIRRQIGALIVKDDVIISTGYNGAVRKAPHCIDIGCMRDKLKIPSGTKIETCRAVHAEMNAIIHASMNDMVNSVIYVTGIPCITCAKMIINAGIKKIVFIDNGYPDMTGLNLLNDMIEVIKC